MIVRQTAPATGKWNPRRIACMALLLLLVGGLLVSPGFLSTPGFNHTWAQQQDDEVVRVNTDLVVLNATVLDKDGKFISGLKRSDFKVLEDGQEQKLSSFGAEETPFAAAITIDTSGSMDTRLTLARSAAIEFLNGLRDEDVAAVYSFDYKVQQWQAFSTGRD